MGSLFRGLCSIYQLRGLFAWWSLGSLPGSTLFLFRSL